MNKKIYIAIVLFAFLGGVLTQKIVYHVSNNETNYLRLGYYYGHIDGQKSIEEKPKPDKITNK